ncbi:MAG: hypothetical protein F4X48_03945 [Acidimicrobiia bacterium]|nr:hypothetical protein [Acidimicrobiia bacterium]MYC57725.1 hypothetical protein [Acidimicrobiia bacterium]MYI29760.1 hypothetical protein [Acidimicrobiia bacterium]
MKGASVGRGRGTEMPSASSMHFPLALPPGWKSVRFGDLVETKSGNSKLIKGKLSSTSLDGLVPAYSASGQDVWTSDAEWQADGVVLSAVGARCGKTFLARGSWTAIANTHVLIPRSGVDPKWLWYLTNDEAFWIKGGTAQPFVKVKDSKSLRVPLPPIQEQRRIAAVLDEAEALREKRRQTLVRLNSLVQSIFINMFGDPVRNEYDWPTVRLGDVAIIERKAVYPGEVNNQEQYVGLENITSNGAVEGVTTAGKADLKSSKFAFNDDHLLYGKLRPYLTKIAAPKFGGICSTDILPIKPGDSLYRYYLLYCLRTPAMVAQATNNAVGINLPRLSPTVLESFEIPLPPIETQRCFDSVVQEIHQQHKTLKTQAHLLDTLFDSLRQRAFRGEL